MEKYNGHLVTDYDTIDVLDRHAGHPIISLSDDGQTEIFYDDYTVVPGIDSAGGRSILSPGSLRCGERPTDNPGNSRKLSHRKDG